MSNKLKKDDKTKSDENKPARNFRIPEFDPYVSGQRLFIIKEPKFLREMKGGGIEHGNITCKH